MQNMSNEREEGLSSLILFMYKVAKLDSPELFEDNSEEESDSEPARETNEDIDPDEIDMNSPVPLYFNKGNPLDRLTFRRYVAPSLVKETLAFPTLPTLSERNALVERFRRKFPEAKDMLKSRQIYDIWKRKIFTELIEQYDKNKRKRSPSPPRNANWKTSESLQEKKVRRIFLFFIVSCFLRFFYCSIMK